MGIERGGKRVALGWRFRKNVQLVVAKAELSSLYSAEKDLGPKLCEKKK